MTAKERARREDRKKQKKVRDFLLRCVEIGAARNRALLGIVKVKKIVKKVA